MYGSITLRRITRKNSILSEKFRKRNKHLRTTKITIHKAEKRTNATTIDRQNKN